MRHRQHSLGGAAFAALLGGIVASCTSMTAPLPKDAVRYDPPAVYSRWWTQIENCSGRSRPLSAVTWYRVPGKAVRLNGTFVSEYWSSRGKFIVVPESLADYATGARHEMLHALTGVGGHPREQFLEACAGLVDCAEACARDAGHWHAPAAFTPLAADSLIIGVETRLNPTELDGQRWLTLVVHATNPASRAIVVSPADWGFGYWITGPTGGLSISMSAYDSSMMYFKPSETKDWQFDFRVADTLTAFTVAAAQYQVRGGFAQRWSQSASVVVSAP